MTNISKKADPRFPDFIVIGAGKSGTTSLDHYLAAHPNIYMSPVKEPNFFALEGFQIPSPQEDPEKLFHYPQAITEKDEYLKLFDAANKEALLGEVSPMYLYSEKAPQRIFDYNPDTKLIVILRQPADRLYSRYLHLARQSDTPTENFSDALDSTTIWWRRDDLVQEGFFYRGLSRYYNLFPAENIKVYLYEDLKNSQEEVVKSMFDFLGVDSSFSPDMSVQFNQSGIIKNKFMDSLVGQKSIFKRVIERVSPNLYESFKKNNTLQKLVQGARKKNLDRPLIEKDIKHQLTHQVYKDDILKLQDLIGRDLSAWLS